MLFITAGILSGLYFTGNEESSASLIYRQIFCKQTQIFMQVLNKEKLTDTGIHIQMHCQAGLLTQVSKDGLRNTMHNSASWAIAHLQDIW